MTLHYTIRALEHRRPAESGAKPPEVIATSRELAEIARGWSKPARPAPPPEPSTAPRPVPRARFDLD